MQQKVICDDETMQLFLQRLEELHSAYNKSPEERRSLADDTIENYVNKAEEKGLHSLHSKFQDLSLRVGYPEEYKEIKRLLQEAEASCEHVFRTFRVPICGILDSLGIEYKFDYRMKSIYSIWKKMRMDNKCFDEVYDLFATRIIYKVPEKVIPLEQIGFCEYSLNPKPLPLDIIDPEILTCFRIYTAITAIYRVQPDRIKDWVTHPKPSGYQALQMTCMGPDCNWIEIQIRSERMHDEAENGSSAHWKYKQGI